MVHARPLSAFCGLLALCSVLVPRASADSLTQSGTFTADNNVVLIPFTASSTQNDTFYTTSYAGGMNADGSTTAAGGFDPVLTLYTGAGSFLAEGGGASVCTGVTNADASTGLCNDAFFTDTLDPGSYLLAVTEFPNYALGDLSAGFFLDTDPTAISDACGSTTPFLESDVAPCVARTGAYTANVSASAVTPEPATWLLLAAPLAGIVCLNRRKLA